MTRFTSGKWDTSQESKSSKLQIWAYPEHETVPVKVAELPLTSP